MDLEQVVFILGSRTELARVCGVTNAVITHWGAFGMVPEGYQDTVKKALRERKRALDQAYKELMK